MKDRARRKILLLEDDRLYARAVRRNLEEYYVVSHAERIGEAMKIVQEDPPDLVLLDMMLQGENGLDFLDQIQDRMSQICVIALTAVDSVENVVRAMRAGAMDYLTKPIAPEELLLAVENALQNTSIIQEVQGHRILQEEENRRHRILGDSPAIEKIREQVEMLGPIDATVLIRGETGTGKEVVARSIHAASERSAGPFVAVNCGAIPRDLFEAEFFGYKKGAFTGADSDTRGKFHLAHKGTLLLDEIGELSAESQVKLLRVLEEQEFYPIGSSELIRVDTRVLASTHRDLAAQVEENQFREDLYYRLNVFEIIIPPLRDRPLDTLALARHFLQQFAGKFRRDPCDLTSSAEKVLTDWSWKGNVRELRNMMERLALTHSGAKVEKEDLSTLFFGRVPEETVTDPKAIQIPPEGIDLDQIEKQLMQQALDIAKGNKSQAARLLNLSPATFYYRMDKYGL